MLTVLTQEDSDDAKDNATCEALSMWSIHMLDYAVSLEQLSRHRSEMMAVCCMHTGYWPRQLAKHLFDTGSMQFRATWQEFVEDRDEPAADGTSEDIILQDVSTTADVADPSESTAINLDRWYRVATPVGLPVGMIR